MTTFLSQIAKITDSLYLSSFVGATEHNLLKFGVTCVITVCKEVPKVDLKHVESIKFDVVDRPTESLARYFDFVSDKINEVAKKKGVCLVHCVAGISRSATMVLAYMMKHMRMNLKEAHAYVKTRRTFIRPNLGFWRQLVDYELNLFGVNTVRIVPSSIGYIPDIYENEVRSMQWAKSNAPLAGTQAASNQAALTGAAAPAAAPAISSNSRATAAENGDNWKESRYSNGGVGVLTKSSSNPALSRSQQRQQKQLMQQQPPSSLQPGSAIPKFSPQLINESAATTAVDAVASRLNRTHYTTTYRSSYQKP